jgi:hypothetical protein
MQIDMVRLVWGFNGKDGILDHLIMSSIQTLQEALSPALFLIERER